MTVSVATLRPALRTARELLDEALVGLRAIEDPHAPIAATERALTAAIDACYRAMADAADAARAREHTGAALEEAREALMCLQYREITDEGARAVSGAVAQSIGELIRAGQMSFLGSLGIPRREGRAAAVPASVDVPRRIELPREVIPAAVVLPKPSSPPAPEPEPIVEGPAPVSDASAMAALQAASARALEALDADDLPPPPAPAPSPPRRARVDEAALSRAFFGEAEDPRESLFEHARVFFEEMSMMGLMRRPDPGDLWHEMEPLEQRLLARLDAIVTVGTWVLPRLVKVIEDRPVPDPELAWGAVLLHGCLAGDDALDEALRVARSMDLTDAAMFEAVTDALTTVPHAGAERAMVGWTRAADPSLRRAALRVLGRRRALSAEALAEHLADADAGVVREAAAAMVGADGAVSSAVLGWLIGHEDDALAHAGMSAAAARGDLRGVLRARDLVASGRAAHGLAALHLAAGCSADMLDAFRVAMRGEGCAALTEALGTAGLAEAVPYLLDRADAGDAGAFVSLQRITGASLTEEDPVGLYEDNEAPFTEAFPTPPTEVTLLEDAGAWRRWWAAHGHRARREVRWRFGRPWTLDATLWELAERDATTTERAWAWMELVARTGRAIPFDPMEWIAVQRKQIDAWRDYVALRRGAFAAGTWTRGGRG